MELLWRIIEVSAIVILVPLGIRLMARVFPSSSLNLSKSDVSFAELHDKYAKWENASIIPFFVVWGLGGYLIYKVLARVSLYVIPNATDNRYVMPMDQALYALPACFLGLTTGVFVTTLLYRLLLGDKYADYILYGNLKIGIDGGKAIKLLILIIFLPSVAFVFLAFNCYIRFTDDRIVINRFLGLSEVSYPYDQITRVKSVRYKEASNEKIVESPYHVIHFSDGSICSTKNALVEAPSSENEKEIFNFVASKAGKEVERFDYLDREDD